MAVKKSKCPASKRSASGEGKRIMNVFYCTQNLMFLYDGFQVFEYPRRGPSEVELATGTFPRN